MPVEMGYQFGHPEYGVPTQPARNGAGMSGFADALDDAMPHVASDAGHDSDRQLACDQHRALFDVQFQPRGHALGIEQRFTARDTIHVGADRPHAIGQRTARHGMSRREVVDRETTEQRA
jgi:hypothetical protein